jgi:hypothetical protein
MLHRLDPEFQPLLSDFRSRPGAVRLLLLVSPT